MALTPADLEALTRVIDERIKRAMSPVNSRVSNHSVSLRAVREEVSPAVAKKISDSQHEVEDKQIGFERITIDSLTQARGDIAELRGEIAELRTTSKGTEAASVAGAHASIAAKDTSADTALTVVQNAAAQRTRARLTLFASIVTTLGVIAQVIERLLH